MTVLWALPSIGKSPWLQTAHQRDPLTSNSPLQLPVEDETYLRGKFKNKEACSRATQVHEEQIPDNQWDPRKVLWPEPSPAQRDYAQNFVKAMEMVPMTLLNGRL